MSQFRILHLVAVWQPRTFASDTKWHRNIVVLTLAFITTFVFCDVDVLESFLSVGANSLSLFTAKRTVKHCSEL
jgi:hypothetical protein